MRVNSPGDFHQHLHLLQYLFKKILNKMYITFFKNARHVLLLLPILLVLSQNCINKIKRGVCFVKFTILMTIPHNETETAMLSKETNTKGTCYFQKSEDTSFASRFSENKKMINTPSKKLILSMSELPSPSVYDLSSSEFVEFSCMAPVNRYIDQILTVEWEYRISGSEDQETIIFITGIYENTNTPFLVAPKFIKLGYRVLIISIPFFSKISDFSSAFDRFTASLHIFRAHIIGNDLGGYLALFLNASHFLSCEIASLTLVSSYTNSSKFKKSLTIFTPISSGTLISEISPDHVPDYLKPSVHFVAKIIQSMDSQLILIRIRLRQSQFNAPIPKENTNKILVIQPIDWAFKLENSHRPNKSIDGVKIVKMQKGGLFPHLAVPDEFFENVLSHIKEFSLQKTPETP